MRTILSLFLILFGLTACALNAASTYDPIAQDPPSIDKSNPPAILEISFLGNGQRMNGILYQANGAGPHPTLVLLHGYPGNEKNIDLAQIMRRDGYNVLFFHYRGAWGSGGSFSFSNTIEDVASAVRMLRERASDYRVDTDQLLLVGHSMGGFTALQGAAHDDQIKCVAALAPADFGFLARNPQAAEAVAASAEELPMLAGWSRELASRDLKDNKDAFSLPGLSSDLSGKSVLLVAGSRDSVLPPAVFHTPLVEAYSAQAGLQLQHKVLPGDHSFSESRMALARLILDWAEQCTAH